MATSAAAELLDLPKEEFKTAYGGWLRSVRDAHGVSRRLVSVYLDMDQGSVKNWENGESLPDVFTHLRLLVYFSATLDARPDLKEWASRVYPTGFAPSLSA